jgi:hypothetical protein
MKLTLNKAWFEKKIQANENYEVGIGVPERIAEYTSSANGDAQGQIIDIDEAFAETHACGTLIEIMRRDQQLTVEKLGTQDDD